MKVKVCGLTTPADALACVAAGVDYVGLNFHPPSPRCITVMRAAEIVAALDSRAEPVALFVDRPPAEVAAVARAIGTDLVQLHGSEPPGYLSDFPGLRFIRAFRLAGPETLAAIADYLAEAERLGQPPFAILIDAHVPGLPGGTGVAIGDDQLACLPTHPRLILAGGLTPENVADRIARARPRPWMVDAASGVESGPGVKDSSKIAALVAASRVVAFSTRMRYEAIPEPGSDDIEDILLRGDSAELRLVALSISLHSDDPEQAERICLRLARHEDGITRGNSVLGLGHVARIHRRLTEHAARPVIEAALRDPDEWVRGQATSAADDIEQFLGWKLDRP